MPSCPTCESRLQERETLMPSPAAVCKATRGDSTSTAIVSMHFMSRTKLTLYQTRLQVLFPGAVGTGSAGCHPFITVPLTPGIFVAPVPQRVQAEEGLSCRGWLHLQYASWPVPKLD